MDVVELIAEAFHRHDKAPSPALWPGERPRKRQYVKVQINLSRSLPSANYPDQMMNWLVLTGTVDKVLSPEKVRVGGLVATTDAAPEAFSGYWRGVLEFQDGLEYPWVLVDLEKEAESE